jgi:hypothetical protein
MNKLEPLTRYDCEQNYGYELGPAYMSECEIGDYCIYADAQAREDVLVEALRGVLEMGHFSEWQKARKILNKIDAEKALMILSQITTEKKASK